MNNLTTDDILAGIRMAIMFASEINNLKNYSGFEDDNSKINFEVYMQRYEKKTLNSLEESLKWAEEHSDYDFKSIDTYYAKKHSNEELFWYFGKLKNALSNMEYDESLYAEDYWDKDPDEQDEWDDYVRETLEKREKEKG